MALLVHCLEIKLEFEMMFFLWREKNKMARGKTIGARMRTRNKINLHVTPGPGVESWSQSLSAWEFSSSVLTNNLIFCGTVLEVSRRLFAQWT